MNWFDWWFRSPDERLAAGGELHPHTGTDLSVPADCVAAAQVDARPQAPAAEQVHGRLQPGPRRAQLPHLLRGTCIASR